MKFVLSAIFSLIFGITVFGQTDSELQSKLSSLENSRFYSVQYDKFKNVSEVRFKAFKVSQDRKRDIPGAPVSTVDFGTGFTFSGQALTAPAQKFELQFNSVSKDWVFSGNHSLLFFVDGVRLDLGEGDCNGDTTSVVGTDKKTTLSVTFNETMIYKTDRAKFAQIANGNLVQFQLGSFTATLTDEYKQMLKDMLALSQPNK